MRRSISRLCSSLLPCLLGLTGAAHAAVGGVHIVGPGGNQAFPTIQAAVDAAADGDVLMVGAGSYAGFTVDGKGLAIHAVQPGQVQVQGSITLVDLPAGRTLLLDGLSATSDTVQVPGLEVVDCAGFVRVEHSAFVAGSAATGQASTGTGVPGARLLGSFQVLFVDTQLTASAGYGKSGSFISQGSAGGDALLVVSGAAALYDCTLQGGDGGLATIVGGPAGHGARVQFGGLFASGSTLTGGKGGFAEDFLPAQGGAGGHGLVVEANQQAQLVDNQLQGGPGGDIFDPSGQIGAPGQPIVTGPNATVVQHPNAKRVYAAPPIVGDAATLDVVVTGEAGDALSLLRGLQAAWAPQVPTTGILTLRPFAKQLYFPLGTLAAASGVVTVPVPDLGPGVTARQFFAQGRVRLLGGERQFSSPFSLLVLGRSELPDCDGDGVNDYLALVEGGVQDCDGNLVPDTCDIAGGFDCNGNGVVDACDIAGGTSIDLNGNGVPDECDPVNAVWHVDASAPSGGDGSPGFPFQSIGAGVAIGLAGDTVLVADGVYTGPDNRQMDFDGRDLVVQSANGPANCIIDLQGQGQAFEMINTFESAAARIEGFTIRNGNAQFASQFVGEGGGMSLISSDIVVRDCVFEDCVASKQGGGLSMRNTGGRVESCVFRGNQLPFTGASQRGAGLMIDGKFGARPVVVGCTFEGNVSGQTGGGLSVFADKVAISDCVIVGNQARFGGGVELDVFAAEPGNLFNCLIVDNAAEVAGGGVQGANQYVMSNCTLAYNTAGSVGGGLRHVQQFGGGTGTLVDCVLWANQAPLGAQIGLEFSGVLTAAYCDLQGGAGAVSTAAGTTFTPGAGLIDVDPLFADPFGPDMDLSTYFDNDFRLGVGSPCADAGSNADVAPDWADVDGDMDLVEQVPFDLAGAPRFQDDPAVADTGVGTPPIVDMGAYERP